MRDIRGDLQDRANLLEEQINAHQAQYDSLIEQFKREYDARLEDLKAELEAVNRLMDLELRRLGSRQPVQSASPQQAQPVQHHPQQHPQQVHPQQAHPQQAHPQQAHPQQVHAQQVHHQQPAQPQPQQPLADFLVRTLGEVGPLSREDLRRIAIQEGYFADGESAERGVTATLLNVAKAGLVRQLPNGNFAPATVLDTIRLRRAI
ncbi:MAG: hypothetical protein ACAH04_09390 [Methylibium sp.]